ncbi:DUF3533 domain-containing protein [Arthrobacter sp. zg-Y820]|uniref:YhgE/Pip domain-containing protein n=1 Tax=unclassified Arthrobacter TaxID=235627 RepID=UPI001E298B06|nr:MULTISPECIES: DUF3533 domain-containing protein [unclassified Arthrobacter]MCC9197851.1 SNG1 family protein [Arthrobacter sp. zg-Y820]MDK1280718.1 DUF3533 domain-containing protein [Arthrobacter sp. zg.Y820]WIB10651.1 DUF3533 domain-containing protein [Arthrobacter sp. zg-Y820]
MSTPVSARPRHAARPEDRRPASPYRSPMFWLLPMLVVVLLAAVGTGLYMGGLANPTAHLKDFPVAVVNEDTGLEGSADGAAPQNLGREIVNGFADRAAEGEELDLQVLSWADAREQLENGEVYAAVVIPASFSADATGLVTGSLTQEQSARPAVSVYTDPKAGALAARLAAGVVEPGLAEASASLGEQLAAAAQDAEAQARSAVEQQLTESQNEQARRTLEAAAKGGPATVAFARQLTAQQAGTPSQLAEQLAPTVSAASAVLLQDPVQVITENYHPVEDGTALGMGSFYYAILLLVLGLTGSIGVNVLVDGRLGITPLEIGPQFLVARRTTPSRWLSMLLKWGIFVTAAAPAAGVVMWVASAAAVPLPNGGTLFLTSWLAMSAVSAVVFALLTVFGNAGLLVSMIYLVLMGLPSSGAVVPLEALPGFFRAIAPWEPLHHIANAVRSVLYFGSGTDTGLGADVVALALILAAALLIGFLVSTLYDRMFGRRGTTAAGPAAA